MKKFLIMLLALFVLCGCTAENPEKENDNGLYENLDFDAETFIVTTDKLARMLKTLRENIKDLDEDAKEELSNINKEIASGLENIFEWGCRTKSQEEINELTERHQKYIDMLNDFAERHNISLEDSE